MPPNPEFPPPADEITVDQAQDNPPKDSGDFSIIIPPPVGEQGE